MENQNIISTIISYFNPVKYIVYVLGCFNNKKQIIDSLNKSENNIQSLSGTLVENMDGELIQNISELINNILASKRDVNNYTFDSMLSAAGYYDTIQNKIISCNGDYLSTVNPSGQGGFSIDIIDMGSGNCFTDDGPKIYPSNISKNIVVGNNNWMYPQNFTVDYTEKNIIIGDDNSVGWEGVNEYLVIGNHNRLKDTQSSLVPGKLIIGNYHFIDSTLTSAQIIAGNYSNPWVKLNDLGLTSDVQEIIGAGTSNRDKKNIFIRDWDGNTWQAGSVKSNQQYLNNRVYNGTSKSNNYIASYKQGNIHTLTVNNKTNLTIEDLPVGCELKIRIDVKNKTNITYNENTIISKSGIYYITFINVIGTVEMLGQPIKIN